MMRNLSFHKALVPYALQPPFEPRFEPRTALLRTAALTNSPCLTPPVVQDNRGHGLNWSITAAPGARVQISLDLEAEGPKVVQWTEIQDAITNG